METNSDSESIRSPCEGAKLISRNEFTRSSKVSRPLALCPNCRLMNPSHRLCAGCGQNLIENENVKLISQRTFQETFKPKRIKVEVDSAAHDTTSVGTKENSSPFKTETSSDHMILKLNTTVEDEREAIEKKLRILTPKLNDTEWENRKFAFDMTKNANIEVRSEVSSDDTVIEETYVNSQLMIIHVIQISSSTAPFIDFSCVKNARKVVFDGTTSFQSLLAVLQHLGDVPFIEFGNDFFNCAKELQSSDIDFQFKTIVPLRTESFVAKCNFSSFNELKEGEQLLLVEKIRFILKIFSNTPSTMEYCSVLFPHTSGVEMLLDNFIAKLQIKGVKAVDYVKNEISFHAGTKPELFLTKDESKLQENQISSHAHRSNLQNLKTQNNDFKDMQGCAEIDAPNAKKPNIEFNSNIVTNSLATATSNLEIKQADNFANSSQTELPTVTSKSKTRDEPEEPEGICAFEEEDFDFKLAPENLVRLVEEKSTGIFEEPRIQAFGCMTINVGDYNWNPQIWSKNLMQNVAIGFSKDGIFFEIPHIITNELIEVYIPHSDVVEIKANFSTEPSCVFIKTKTSCASSVRSALGLLETIDSDKYFCPNSEHGCQRLIYFQQIQITDNARQFLHSVFNEVLSEIDNFSAKVLLFQSRCLGLHENTQDDSLLLSLFASDDEEDL